ncbi:MAG: DUF2800 domain-containing protein, partial [Gammaproteobacteria bacterium]|nr:DUF2800 domain-containing protein [Gammaproteobacteria bacterium]
LVLHEMMAQEDDLHIGDFSDDQQWILEQCALIKQEIQAYLVIEGAERLIEQRFWLTDDKKNRLCSGRVDFLAVDRDKKSGLLIDYKTGWKGAADAARNMQLRWLAALVFFNLDLDTLFVSVVQPRVREEQFSIARYERKNMVAALAAMKRALERVDQPNAPRVPGMYCDYCHGKAICPEARVVVARLSKFPWKSLDGKEASRFLDMCLVAEKIAKAVRAHYGLRLADEGDCLPGYTVGRKTTRIIPSNTAAYAKLRAINKVSKQEFFEGCCRLRLDSFIGMVARRYDMTFRSARDWVEQILGDAAYHKESNPFPRAFGKGSRKRFTKLLEDAGLREGADDQSESDDDGE